MLWEVVIRPEEGLMDRHAEELLAQATQLPCPTLRELTTAKVFLLETDDAESKLLPVIERLLVDPVVERFQLSRIPQTDDAQTNELREINVLYKPGMTDAVAENALRELKLRGCDLSAVATCRRYFVNEDISSHDLERFTSKLLANSSIENVVHGPLELATLEIGKEYDFKLVETPIKELTADELIALSEELRLSLSREEMLTIQQHFRELDREPTDVELETIAQTWSEHCSHKTLAGRISYRDDAREIQYENMLKETIFAATTRLREQWGDDDWCVSVFRDNAGVVTFNENFDVCFKVETHNRPSALEPYGGANTGLGGVIRDSLGTGLGARPVCSTDVFCFAPFEIPHDDLPPGVMHPQSIAHGVVAGVRDYGNRMGIPTVNGAVYFDERYIGNPLVYCGNAAILPRGKAEKVVEPGSYIVSVGGRTGLDGIKGATFSSAKLTDQSEVTSGGAVQIGNAITEKMVMDAVLAARDEELFTAITDCGAGGFSSAIGEMGEETGAEVWLDRAPLKYSGLSYTEIWISEAQERMVLCVPVPNWERFREICDAEGVEATILGKFTGDKQLTLKYREHLVGELSMEFLHDGRPPVVREAKYTPVPVTPLDPPEKESYNEDLLALLASPNIASKEWIIRQYDHEVLAGSVVKPLVGIHEAGPSDAAMIRPDLNSNRGLVISNGMNPNYGDYDPYWMAASAIDEAIRNAVAVGADPNRIAILDNFCWGNTNDPEKLGSLVRAAIGCQETSLAFGTPFISGKDSLHNEFSYESNGEKQTVAIPCSLLISAMGQIPDVHRAITMDLKEPGNLLFLIGETHDEFAGSHYAMLHKMCGGHVPKVSFETATQTFAALHEAISEGLVRSCHDLSEGGLAVALAEMAFAGGLGAEVKLVEAAKIAKTKDDVALLFAESNTRFLVEVNPEQQDAFEWTMRGLPVAQLGTVSTQEDSQLRVIGRQGQTLIESSLETLETAWRNGISWD